MYVVSANHLQPSIMSSSEKKITVTYSTLSISLYLSTLPKQNISISTNFPHVANLTTRCAQSPLQVKHHQDVIQVSLAAASSQEPVGRNSRIRLIDKLRDKLTVRL